MPLAQEQLSPQWLNSLLAAVPWILIFLVAWFFMYRELKREKHRKDELEATRAQVAALQRRVDELSKSSDSSQSQRISNHR
jgi:flagellar biosynthesis/type III secretory pathway M-ring protein FliF/YscJ